MNTYLDYYTAEDVKGIEMMYNSQYNSAYNHTYLPVDSIEKLIKKDWVYIEITTRSGKGPFMHKTNGTYLYKPLPFTWPKEFYRPRYNAVNKTAPGADLRSTIHWEPNITTDASGKATVSFFSADKPGTYTLIFQGSDVDGNIGEKTRKVLISP
jgi:hypothetical protein